MSKRKASSELQEQKASKTRRTEKVPCDWIGCGKLISSSNMAVHRRIHTKDKPFTCTTDGCGKAFATSSGLAQHLASHSTERPFQCDVSGCAKAFKTNAGL